MNFRFIELNPVDLPRLHATELAITKSREDTVLLWRPDRKCITLGYFQIPEQELDLEYCKENDMPITRRIGGGGVGVLNLMVPAYSIIANEDSGIIPKSIEKSYEVICNGIVLALKELGIKAEFSPINDVLINGKKFSGSSQFRVDTMVVQHGFITLWLDIPEMVKVLKIVPEKLMDKGVKTLEERVTFINREAESQGLGPFEFEDIRDAAIKGFEEALGIDIIKGELTDEEKKTVDEEIKRFQSDEWNFKAKLFEKANLKAVYKAKKGVIKISAWVLDGQIKDLMITGDFLIYPEGALTDIENALKGAKLNEKELVERVRSIEREGVEFVGISAEDFAKAILSGRRT